jgi:hypothetical protein
MQCNTTAELGLTADQLEALKSGGNDADGDEFVIGDDGVPVLKSSVTGEKQEVERRNAKQIAKRKATEKARRM